MRGNTKVVSIDPGKYVIGDPCYSIPDERWIEWLEKAGYIDERDILIADLDGHICVGVSTAYGDGVYYGNDGGEYGVDSGLIGLVAAELAPNAIDVVEFTESPVECFRDENGGIHLGHIIIETDPQWEEEE